MNEQMAYYLKSKGFHQFGNEFTKVSGEPEEKNRITVRVYEHTMTIHDLHSGTLFHGKIPNNEYELKVLINLTE